MYFIFCIFDFGLDFFLILVFNIFRILLVVFNFFRRGKEGVFFREFLDFVLVFFDDLRIGDEVWKCFFVRLFNLVIFFVYVDKDFFDIDLLEFVSEVF